MGSFVYRISLGRLQSELKERRNSMAETLSQVPSMIIMLMITFHSPVLPSKKLFRLLVHYSLPSILNFIQPKIFRLFHFSFSTLVYVSLNAFHHGHCDSISIASFVVVQQV